MDAITGQRLPNFKTCPNCGAQWRLRTDMLRDPDIRLLGFQPGPNGHRSGFLLFCHQGCGTSMALGLPLFEDLAPPPILAPAKCARGLAAPFCMAALENAPCPLECICDFVWAVLSRIHEWPKRPVLA